MAYSKQLFRTVLLILLSFLPLELCAQATIDELLDGYVTASVNGESTTPYRTKINQIYKNYQEEQQDALRTQIYDRVVVDTIMDQNNIKRKFALIDLYALLADTDDNKLDDLYFAKGEICGLHTGDTIMLKECITSLKLSDHSKSASVKGYVNTLQGYLEEIRNYLPVSKRIDGVWVSNIIEGTRESFGESYIDLRENTYIPSFVIIIENGVVRMDPWGFAWTKGLAKISESGLKPAWSNHSNYKLKDDEQTISQIVMDIENNKLYMVWSNEKLKIPNQTVALSVGQTAGDITTNVVIDALSSAIGNIGSDIVGGLAGNLVSGIIMNMFAPSKKINILELELEQKNDYELIGKSKCQFIKIDGDGKPTIDSKIDDVVFEKYDPLSGVFFGSPTCRPKYIPTIPITDKIPTICQSALNEERKYRKSINLSKSLVQWPKYQQRFSNHQIKKLAYYNKTRLGSKTQYIDDTYKKIELGVVIDEKVKEENIKEKNSQGCYVYDIKEDAPAYIFGIKKGDIILSIDSYEMNNPQKVEQYIQSLKPYDWVTVHLKRGKKEMDIEVELTWN